MTGEGQFFSGRKSRFSQTIANTKTFTIDTAENLQTLPKKGGMPMIPTTTSGLYTKNKPVFYDVDENGSVVPFGMKAHDHTSSSDDKGGLFDNIWVSNAGLMVPFYGYNFQLGEYYEQKTGTGAGVVLNVGSSAAQIDVIAGTSLNGYDNIKRIGGVYRFNDQSMLEIKFQYDGATLFTNYLIRCGINCEMINDANDPNTNMYCLEACPADAKILVASCAALGARSTVPTVFNNDEVTHVWLLRHLPANTKIQVCRDTDFTPANVTEKTNDIPTSGSTKSAFGLSMGVKSTVSSASKKFIYKGAVFYGAPEGNWKWAMTDIQ